MKILMTLMGLDIGGAETHVVELCRELHRRGHQVLVASNGGVYEQTLTETGITHVKIPMHRRSIPDMAASLRMLRELICREKPDLVHAHARIPAFLCGILQKKLGFPLITTAHGVFDVTPMLRFMSNWGDRTVAVSHDIREYLRREYQLPEDQIHLTINGIDTDTFCPRPCSGGEAPVICWVGRLDEASSDVAEMLLGCIPGLTEEFPALRLMLVGGGTREKTIRHFGDEINRKTGRQTVTVTGPRTDVAELLAGATVFVGVSRAALEAMATEKPVILAGNPVYGQGYMGLFTRQKLPQTRENNFTCRGCEETTGEKLFRDIKELLSMSPEERLALGQFGRETVERYYSVSRMTDDYLESYRCLLHPKPVIKAVVSGYYGYGNLGDDAILQAISRELSSPEQPVRLTVLSKAPAETRKQYGLPAVRRFSPLGVYRALKASDVLISGGGSLLQDKTSTRSLLYYLWVIRMARRLGKPVFIYANGIGPLTQKQNRRRVRQCLNRCDRITLRDQASLQELRALGVERKDIRVTGDPVFRLTPDGQGENPLRELGIPEQGQIVGVSVRSLPQTEKFIREFARLCDRLVREGGKTVVFLVMQENMDEGVSQQIRQQMAEKSYLVKSPGKPDTMLEMIREMELVIAMRLHTIIFAASVNVPVLGCVYDPKVGAVLQQLDMPDCGTPDTMDGDKAYEKAMELLGRIPEAKQQMQIQVESLRGQAADNVRLFRQMMEEQGR